MKTQLAIRPTSPNDVATLVRLTRETGFFKPLEIETLEEVFADYFAGTCGPDHHCRTLEDQGQIVGFAYFAPAAMTDRAWYLFWIVVARESQGRGYGSMLLEHVEREVRNRGGRVLFIETSSLPRYTPTRQFYSRRGYDHEATLRDFYAAGDDMIVFRKAL